MNYLDDITSSDKSKDYYKEQIERLSTKTLILFGAGNMSEFVIKSIRNKGLTPVCFCDNDIKKVGTYIQGIPVISFEELCRKHRNSNIYITSTFYYSDIRRQLLENGFVEENICSLDLVYMFPWEENYFDYISNHKRDFEDLLSILSDHKSKEVLLGRLNFLKSRERKYMTDIRTDTQYFEKDLINLNTDEIFMDLGAYDGDSIRSFLSECNNKYDKIYALEPEEDNYNKLVKYCENTNISNIEIAKAGIWNKDGQITYTTICKDFAITLAEDSLNFDSEFKDEKNSMETRTVDSILNGEAATFIKMDVVGVEREALEGAKKTIQKYKPILAVCVYHKASDIYALPKYILQLCPEYKIYLRHYSDGVSETVCYAIPSTYAND